MLGMAPGHLLYEPGCDCSRCPADGLCLHAIPSVRHYGCAYRFPQRPWICGHAYDCIPGWCLHIQAGLDSHPVPDTQIPHCADNIYFLPYILGFDLCGFRNLFCLGFQENRTPPEQSALEHREDFPELRILAVIVLLKLLICKPYKLMA